MKLIIYIIFLSYELHTTITIFIHIFIQMVITITLKNGDSKTKRAWIYGNKFHSYIFNLFFLTQLWHECANFNCLQSYIFQKVFFKYFYNLHNSMTCQSTIYPNFRKINKIDFKFQLEIEKEDGLFVFIVLKILN